MLGSQANRIGSARGLYRTFSAFEVQSLYPRPARGLGGCKIAGIAPASPILGLVSAASLRTGPREAMAALGGPKFAATLPGVPPYGWTTPSITFGAAVTVGLTPI